MRRPPSISDILAGFSVALLLIPQSLAYAEIAGVPTHVGLFAAALPPLLAAPFMSSPYLQTGPVALTSLLTFGALSGLETTGTAEYVELAALLALIVGVTRLLLGVFRLGGIAYLMSQPVLMGFTNAAAILIVSAQLPSITGASPDNEGVLQRAGWTLAHPGEWAGSSLVLTVVTVAVILGSRRVHRLFPGVLIIVAATTAWSELSDYTGPIVGELPGGFLSLGLDLPFDRSWSLLIPGIVIAVVGFAEPASISRTFATADRIPWSANRELVGSGVANLASAISGGFPVGGSFSRSSLNRFAGARSNWSSAVTGAVVIASLPLAPTLEPLPLAVLGAIVFVAVFRLIQPLPILKMWTHSALQGAVATGTFVATLATAPNVERGVVIGVGLSILAHLTREMRVDHEYELDGDTLVIRPAGVIWFATTPQLERMFIEAVAEVPEISRLRIDFTKCGRFDYSGAATLATLVDDAENGGTSVEMVNIPPHGARALASFMGGKYGVPTLDELPVDEPYRWITQWRQGESRGHEN